MAGINTFQFPGSPSCLWPLPRWDHWVKDHDCLQHHLHLGRGPYDLISYVLLVQRFQSLRKGMNLRTRVNPGGKTGPLWRQGLSQFPSSPPPSKDFENKEGQPSLLPVPSCPDTRILLPGLVMPFQILLGIVSQCLALDFSIAIFHYWL